MSWNLTEGRVRAGLNASIDDDDYAVTVGSYFLFKHDADELTKEQCLVDDAFNKTEDDCLENPIHCTDGLTLSFFYYANYTETTTEMYHASETFEREYLISTGGERGTPGIAIWRRGSSLGAVVSTGNETWEVEVAGILPRRHTWANIAIRWEPPVPKTQAEYDTAVAAKWTKEQLGGLELFVNMDSKGHVLYPVHFDDPWEEGFSPPEMMVGCHRTKANPTARNHAGGRFDELATWRRQLNDSEKLLFMGGYQENLDHLSANELLSIVLSVDMGDLQHASVIFTGVTNIVDGGKVDEPEFRDILPESSSNADTGTGTASSSGTSSSSSSSSTNTQDTGTESESALSESSDVDELLVLLEISNKMIETSDLRDFISPGEFLARLEGSAVIGEILSTKSRYADSWAELGMRVNHEGAHPTRDKLADFLTYLTERRRVSHDDDPYVDESINLVVSTENQAIQVIKKKSEDYHAMGDKENYIKMPDYETTGWRTAYETWGLDVPPKDYIKVPTVLFSGDCDARYVSLVLIVNDQYPDNGRKNPVFIRANNVILDSRVVTVKVSSNGVLADNTKIPTTYSFHERCEPEDILLIRGPVQVTFEILSVRHDYGRRKLQGYFDELDSSKVRRRHCVIFDPDVGLHGAWTTEGVKTIHVDEATASCSSIRMGSFAIVAEIEDDPYREDDEDWLYILKMVGYGLSIFCLLVFMLVILMSTYLWEMFHTLGLHLAGCLVFANVAMIVSELDSVRDDIKICATVACLINFFYVAAASILTMESYALFRAIISGVIGGRTLVYLCLGYSLPFMALGVNIYKHLSLMGTEPGCFVSWYSDSMWTFLGPMVALAALALIFMVIVVCNIRTPALRKESIIKELGSIALGMTFLVVLFGLTWSFAPLAYIRYPDKEMPDFYPAFHVLNSFCGVFVFLFLGLGSARFRTVITGGVGKRQQDLSQTESWDNTITEDVGSITNVETEEAENEDEDDDEEENSEAIDTEAATQDAEEEEVDASAKDEGDDDDEGEDGDDEDEALQPGQYE